MARTQGNTAVNARRFAALLAGFDLGNADEEEAVAKARALRRMAAESGMRVVDLLELPDVKAAVDAQMQPRRADTPDLHEALGRVDELEDELSDRMRDVTRLAELLRRQEERTEAVSRELAGARMRAYSAPGPPPPVPARNVPAHRVFAPTKEMWIGAIAPLMGLIGWIVGMIVALRHQ